MFEKLATPIITLAELRQMTAKVTGAKKLWGALTPAEASLAHLHSPDLTPRPMQDSFSRVVIPLSSIEYREKYINYLKQIRFGRLLEDLDSFAVYLAYKHNGMISGDKFQRADFSNVTALVDRILVRKPANPALDVHMSGYVSWVGRSSLETTMHLEQVVNNNKVTLLSARFVMVAIDAVSKSATPVTPLAAKTEEEKAVLALGQRNYQRRLNSSRQSLFRKPPDATEAAQIHELYLSTLDPQKHSFKERSKPSDDVWMKDTSIKSIIICQPENRNMYSKIFGGFLMRTAYELAWAEAWAFSGTRPQCVAVDDIVFRKPVEVGSLLYLHQSIGYTEDDLIQTRVTAEVTDVNDASTRELANIFHFTFRAPLPSGRPPLPRIIPDSYGEAMLYLDSRRRLTSTKDHLVAEPH